MSIMTHIVVFTISWWLVLFMVLPFGVRTAEEDGKERDPGTAEGAPHNPQIVKKMLITTAIATVVWLIYWMIVSYEIITLEDVMK